MEAPEGKFSFAPLVSCGSQRRKGIFMTSKWAYRYVTNCKTRVFSFELKPVYFCCFSLGVDFLIPLLPVSSPAYWNVLGPLLRCFFFFFFLKKIQIHDMWSCLFCMCFEKILEIASMSCSCSDISYTLTDLAYLSTFNTQVDSEQMTSWIKIWDVVRFLLCCCIMCLSPCGRVPVLNKVSADGNK